MKRWLSRIVLILPIPIIVGLVVHTWYKHPEAFEALADGLTSPVRFVAGLSLIVVASVISFFRWHLLMRTLNIPIRLRDTMRLGFLGQALNFVGLGQVGGDVFKAFFIAHEQPRLRAEAIGTIVVDRVCGLYALLIVATGALLLSDLDSVSGDVATIAKATYAFTAIGTVAMLLVLTPQVARSKLMRRTTEVPKVGKAIKRLLNAVYLYQNNKVKLAAIGVISLGVHTLIALAIYLGATGIFASTPPMIDLFVISPVACVAGAIPLTPGGLGTYEAAMTYLYNLVSAPDEQGRGIVVSFVFRLGMIIVAAIGVVLYWLRHREVTQIMHEVEEFQEAEQEKHEQDERQPKEASR